MRHVWLLILGMSLLSGCGKHHQGAVSNDVLTDLTASMEKVDPPSPYHVRGVASSTREEAAILTSTVTAQAPPTGPMIGGQEPADVRSLDLPAPMLSPVEPPPIPMTPTPDPEPTPPPKPKDPLHSALGCFREDRPVQARKHLESFPPAQREALQVLLPLVARLGDSDAKPQSLSDLVEMLERLAQSLRSRSGLSLEKLCYVRSVEGFGVYEPLPSGHTFQPGSAGRPGDLVQLYAELKNFQSESRGSDFETALACTLVVRDAKNGIVWEQGRPVQIERCRSPRQDCHLRCNFYVPPGLPVGDYTLWLVVKDVTGASREEVSTQRTAKRSLDFRVRGQSAVMNP